MRYISSQLERPIRILALSTSLANAKDMGEWIGATSHGMFNFPPGALDSCVLPSAVHSARGSCSLQQAAHWCPASLPLRIPPLSAGVRPVPLEIHIQGFDIVNLEARMQVRRWLWRRVVSLRSAICLANGCIIAKLRLMSVGHVTALCCIHLPPSQAMLRPAYSAIGQHARDGQPAIVFVPTRKHAKMAALDLLTHAAADGAPHKFRQVCSSTECWHVHRHPYLAAAVQAAGRSGVKCDSGSEVLPWSVAAGC